MGYSICCEGEVKYTQRCSAANIQFIAWVFLHHSAYLLMPFMSKSLFIHQISNKGSRLYTDGIWTQKNDEIHFISDVPTQQWSAVFVIVSLSKPNYGTPNVHKFSWFRTWFPPLVASQSCSHPHFHPSGRRQAEAAMSPWRTPRICSAAVGGRQELPDSEGMAVPYRMGVLGVCWLEQQTDMLIQT